MIHFRTLLFCFLLILFLSVDGKGQVTILGDGSETVFARVETSSFFKGSVGWHKDDNGRVSGDTIRRKMIVTRSKRGIVTIEEFPENVLAAQGARRGTVVHRSFSILKNPKGFVYYDAEQNENDKKVVFAATYSRKDTIRENPPFLPKAGYSMYQGVYEKDTNIYIGNSSFSCALFRIVDGAGTLEHEYEVFFEKKSCLPVMIKEVAFMVKVRLKAGSALDREAIKESFLFLYSFKLIEK